MPRDNERPGKTPGLLHVVVLGGYGLIGSAVMRRLAASGHRVTGVGRSAQAAERSPFSNWQIFDIGTMDPDGWRNILAGVDVVVNASGALQDGARDDLKAIHETALANLAKVLAGTPTRFVQISAAGVSLDATTEFFRSKARGEAMLTAADLDMVILRPTLVLSPAAYGGTALLRAGAALPFVLPKVLPDALINCVHIDDLAKGVLDATEGRLPSGATIDVTGDDARSLPELLRRTRQWLGFSAPVVELPLPSTVLSLISRSADLAGHLGWRSPLRTTAVRVLQDGVRGDPQALPNAGGKPCRTLEEIFATLPATIQERWFARAYLMLPVAIVMLALFWLLSGLIGAVRFQAASEVLTARGWSGLPAGIAVLGGALADITLGALILWRPWVKRAALGMIALSLAYLAGGTFAAPDLWLDPLGPFVKVLPGVGLALFVLALADDR